MESQELSETHKPAVTNSVKLRRTSLHDADYHELVNHMQQTLQSRLATGRSNLFRTVTKMKGTEDLKLEIDVDLNMVYLGSLTDEREYHSCSCCSHFLRRFGGLVTIDTEGKTHAAFWDSETFPKANFYFPAVEKMQEVVEGGRVLGVHKSSDSVWGAYTEGGYDHFGITSPAQVKFVDRKLTGPQKQAQVLEDYNRMAKAFSTSTFSIDNLKKLMQLIEGEVLAGDEKIADQARWLYDTAVERDAMQHSRRKANLLWRAIAGAPTAWSHATSTMVNTVLEDLEKGVSVAVLAKRYAAKTAPDVHRRPVATPSIGLIESAEQLVAKLGIRDSLRRRVGTIDDIQKFIWDRRLLPQVAEPEQTSVFGHLKPKGAPEETELELPVTRMSWNKFAQDILPKVEDIEIYIPLNNDMFVGFLAGAVESAPPILQYDYDDARNSVQAYMRSEKDEYSGKLLGMHPQKWNLTPGRFYKVLGMTEAPYLWGQGNHLHLGGEQITFLIEGAYDKQMESDATGLALFPTLLKADLHEISRVIEKFSNEGKVEGEFNRQVAGLNITKGSQFIARRLKAKTEFGIRDVLIDRWE